MRHGTRVSQSQQQQREQPQRPATATSASRVRSLNGCLGQCCCCCLRLTCLQAVAGCKPQLQQLSCALSLLLSLPSLSHSLATLKIDKINQFPYSSCRFFYAFNERLYCTVHTHTHTHSPRGPQSTWPKQQRSLARLESNASCCCCCCTLV